jgi:hypothetical protein
MARPKIKIDWEKAKHLAIAGCNGVQIAAFFGMHNETFYDRCVQENGIGFTDWLQQNRSKGDAMLIAKQFEVAYQDKERGMLIWLGKQRLGQRENPNDNSDEKEFKFTITHKLE